MREYYVLYGWVELDATVCTLAAARTVGLSDSLSPSIHSMVVFIIIIIFYNIIITTLR